MRVHMCDVHSGGQRRAFGKAGPAVPGASKRPSSEPAPPSPLSQVCSRPLAHRRLSGSRTITQQARAERLGRAAHPSATASPGRTGEDAE